MIRVLALAAAMTAIPVVMTAPVVSAAPAFAYDPCVRATQDYRRALAAYEAAQTCTRNRIVCNSPQAEARRLNAARERMEDACR
ncbi:hypothetical protein MMB232_03022 [Brevundimonas subvibrioides]|uniref:hypothetical protein n=1 Tax=Brevundimonas subvibrioides TaxID=74313 RepID=UPI0032D5969F